MVGLLVALWWLAVTVLTVPAALAFTRVIWSGDSVRERECAFAAALVLGPWIVAIPLWLGAWYGFWSVSGAMAWAMLIALTVCGRRYLRGALPRLGTATVLVSMYAALFLGWALFRAFNPEIFWGEKPMDFSFLNHLIRAEQLPPDDPWAAGHPLNYYYFGQFVWAVFHKLTGVDSAYGYNLALSSIGASIGLALWTFVRSVQLSRFSALVAIVVIGLGSNLEWIRLLTKGSPGIGFDFFWATSRLITSPVISEYPSWSVLFGDLHAHLCALPISYLFQAMAIALFSRIVTYPSRSFNAEIAAWGGFGILLGVLYASNSWDLIPSAGFIALLALYALCATPVDARPRLQRLKDLAVRWAVLGVGFALWMVPWLSGLGEGVKIEYWWVVQDFSRFDQLVRHFGQFWILLFVSGIGLFIAGWQQQPRKITAKGIWRWLIVIAGALAPIVLGVYVAQFAQHTPPFSILIACGVMLGSGIWLLSAQSSIAGPILIAAGGLTALCELVYVMDHTNTMFKLYLSLWCWFGVVALCAVEAGVKRFSGPMRTALLGVSGVSALLVVVGSIINVAGLAPFQRVQGPRPTLNGLAYLSYSNGDEAKLIYWMREHIEGVPVFAEAYGDSYREFGRIAMHTGLPAVLGWDHHISQRAVNHADRDRRRHALRRIYGSDSPGLESTREALAQYAVQYVVVGTVEQRLAGGPTRDRGSDLFVDADKFESHPELFNPVARFGSVVLYRVTL